MKVFLGNLPFNFGVTEVNNFLQDNGYMPGAIVIVHDRETRKPKGCAFVELPGPQDNIDLVIKQLKGIQCGGRPINVAPPRNLNWPVRPQKQF